MTRASETLPPQADAPVRAAELTAAAAGCIAILVGAIHLAAWVGGMLTKAPVGAIVMKANTSLCLLLSGLALVALSTARGLARRRVAAACAVLVTVIAALTLSEHIVGWDLGIDQLLATEMPGAAATVSPNRMGLPASSSFILLGAALIVLASGNRGRFSTLVRDAFALTVALLALLSTIGYLYGVTALYGIAQISGVAWPTALSLLALAVGVLCARPREGVMAWVTADDDGGVILRRLLLPMVVLPLFTGWLRLYGERAGWFNAEMGTSLTMLVVIVSFSLLAFYGGRRVSRSARHRLEAERLTRAMAAINQTLLSARDPAGVMQQAVLQAADAIGCQTAAVSLRDGPGWYVAYTHGFPPEVVGTRMDDQQEPHALLAIQSRNPVAIDDAFSDDRANSAHMKAWGIRSVLVVPLFTTDEVLGVLFLNFAEPFTFRDVHVAFASQLASSLSLALDNSRLLASLRSELAERMRAEESLRETDRRKSEFLATLSHELRNPLAPIRYALALMGHNQDKDVAQPRRVIERQLAHLVHVVDDLLDLTRIESDKIRLRKERTDLVAVAREAIEAAMPEIEQAQHTVTIRLPSEPVWLDADRVRIAQILSNLLNNATRYTPAGGRLSLTVVPHGEDAVVSVADSGIGLREEDRERVFEMFTQVGEPGKGGLGIGLALVKKLVELHAGSVEVRSEGLGHGCEFRVRLPRASAAAAAKATRAPCPEAAPGPRRVLVVDDNLDAADMMRTLLEMGGHEVRVAHDAASACDVIAEFRPHVGLFDIGLPGADGYELARMVRNDPSAGTMYLVAVTGWGQEEDRQRAQACGFDAHLTKPADPEQVLRAVAQARARQ